MDFTVMHICCGMGGAALGFQASESEYRGVRGTFHTLGGIDVDPEACQDFESLTGVAATQMDLFSRKDYVAFHGHQPPRDWREAKPEDIRRVCDGISPDVVFISAPCKGYTGLISNAKANTPKYQALNNLALRSLVLALEAFSDDPPGFFMFENVPRITSRGQHLLDEIERLLGSAGYAFHEGYHDCGQLGALAQRRRRYLLIARHQQKVPALVYQPVCHRLRTVGEVLERLPMPDDPSAGPLHRLPRLQWRTWVRLALIPAGGDWRDLNFLAGKGWFKDTYGIIPWDEPAGTITGKVSPSCGTLSVADPRLGHRPRAGSYRVVRWDETATTVIGSAGIAKSNGVACVADPRLPLRDNRHPNVYRVIEWHKPGLCITGTRFGSGAPAIADPRLNCRPRNGTYGVLAWNEPATTVTGAMDIHSGSAAVADPRIPLDNERPDPPPIIISLDGTWHRPLTTLELAALQGFPTILPNGQPLTLAGRSDSRWRERIGNAVPPPAAKAIGDQILRALLLSAFGTWELGTTPLWVVPDLPWKNDLLLVNR